MKVSYIGSPFTTNRVLLVYAVATTMVAASLLLLPAQPTAPNVVYNLFKIGQTSIDQTLVNNGWKPVGYTCQAANSEQSALGFGPTVCGYSYATTSHNLITTGGIDWLACRMTAATTSHCVAVDKYIALTTDSTAPAAGDCGTGSNACTLTSEITSGGLARATGTVSHTNGTSTYTVVNTFTASATFNGVQKSGLFNEPCVACSLPVGAMVFENTFSSTNMLSGDTLQVTWTITL